MQKVLFFKKILYEFDHFFVWY